MLFRSGQAVVSTQDLVEFPCVQAFVAAQKTAGFTGRADEFCPAHGTKHVDNQLVVVGSVGRDANGNALADVLVGPPAGLLADLFVMLLRHASHSITHGSAPSAVIGRRPSSSRTHVSSLPTLPSA